MMKMPKPTRFKRKFMEGLGFMLGLLLPSTAYACIIYGAVIPWQVDLSKGMRDFMVYLALALLHFFLLVVHIGFRIWTASDGLPKDFPNYKGKLTN